jgi:signal transduction histidine kinase
VSRQSKVWLACAGGLVLVQAAAALLLSRGFALTLLTDSIEFALLASGTLALLPNAWANQGRIRIFWFLMAAGMGLWLLYQLLWNYFEIYLRRDVPDLFAGDVVLFLHVVPMMAALALRPHALQDERTTRFTSLDFALLLIWWLYLYVFCVMPWLHASPNVIAYAHNQNLIYTVEKIVFLAWLLVAWRSSSRSWRFIYAQLLGASLLYALGSYLANWAIEKDVYYSGSVYDVVVTASMAWFTAMALHAREMATEQKRVSRAPRFTVWTARLGMIAIFSLPVVAVWTIVDSESPVSVRNFRLLLTLGTMMILGAMVFFKQHLLDKELMSLLKASQSSFEDLKRLQGQLLQSEKMASLGQLLGGAAHELNNPITAMLGYSELLASSPLGDDERELAGKIGSQVKNARSLVAGLLSFARQVPSAKTAVDINAVVQTALKLSQPELRSRNISVHANLAPDLPRILGDSNQLLQVFLHFLTSRLATAGQTEGSDIWVVTLQKGDSVVLELRSGSESSSDTGRSQNAEERVVEHDVNFLTCNGIVQEHLGRIEHRNLAGGIQFQVVLPIFAGFTSAISVS